MELTINFIRNSFQKYNQKYFNNELIEPKLGIINTKTILGRFRRDKSMYRKQSYIIEISKYYARNEKEYDNTIIHEMIHQYIAQKGIKDNSSHGYYFKSFAAEINRDGWHIQAHNSIDHVDLDASNKKEYHVFMYKIKGDKYFLFVSAKSSVNAYKIWLKKYKYEYKYFTSLDSMKYGKMTTCQSRIRGYYITKEEYDSK